MSAVDRVQSVVYMAQVRYSTAASTIAMALVTCPPCAVRCRYPYITLIYNICYAVALFWLLLLYVGTDELLKVEGCGAIMCLAAHLTRCLTKVALLLALFPAVQAHAQVCVF